MSDRDEQATKSVTNGTEGAHRAAVSLAYIIDAEQRLVTITGEYADASAWKAVLAHIIRDPRHRPGFAVLRDLRNATTPTDAATVMEISKVVRHFWRLMHPARVAILTPLEQDPAALVAQALGDARGVPLRMFLSYDEAVGWLADGKTKW